MPSLALIRKISLLINESSGYSGKLPNSIAIWLRYSGYLKIIWERTLLLKDKLSENYDARKEVLNSARSRPDHALTDENLKSLTQLIKEEVDLSERSNLEIETFYLFSKILLDQTANTIYLYFDEALPENGSSFSKLLKSNKKEVTGDFVDFVKFSGDTEEFRNVRKWLKENITLYRNKEIEHTDASGVVRQVEFDYKTRKIKRIRYHPTETLPEERTARISAINEANEHKNKESLDLEEVLRKIDIYLENLTDFLLLNILKPK